MSAFMVNDETINRIVNYLVSLPESLLVLVRLGYFLISPEDAKRLAENMFQLNVRSIEARYGKGQAATFRDLDFAYVPGPPEDLAQVVKSLHCWQYQSCEGNCDQDPLYRTMSNVLEYLQPEDMEGSPAYDAAVWG